MPCPASFGNRAQEQLHRYARPAACACPPGGWLHLTQLLR
ncbi:hypothetical protein Y88_2632 [Novosphingobium nitrogenifigens DSM 19370]|uniref:Uncharacterized protein n=1 Tax=Novosphingobium nitrogenifigens DSM 19370 TaxID=983920 RepID=F1Z6Y3_9SPHN|nr:hypothetical protein Y88_2632 [Novosphingobium nitrogenifigens DSM 19370]